VTTARPVPLPTLLSHALVAFTIDVDNRFEQQMPHRTSRGRQSGEPGRGPWLVSLPMWSTFMRFVPAAGISVGALELRAFGDTDLRGRNPGMVRWGYVSLSPDPGDQRPKVPLHDWFVRPTDAGRRAQEIWRPLPMAVERRWADLFGRETVAFLRCSLAALVRQLVVELPDYLPTNGAHGGRAEITVRPLTGASRGVPTGVDLSALMAKVLLTFTLDFDLESPLSLVMSANPVRALGAEPVAVRDLPRMTGVAKETLTVMLGGLAKSGHLVREEQVGGNVARLTASGLAAQQHYHERVQAIEKRWHDGFGSGVVTDLRHALETLIGDPVLARSPLAAAIEPPDSGWRAKVARPEVLPHHPVVSHRGRYPDGS
jgi:hypothetical protein